MSGVRADSGGRAALMLEVYQPVATVILRSIAIVSLGLLAAGLVMLTTGQRGYGHLFTDLAGATSIPLLFCLWSPELGAALRAPARRSRALAYVFGWGAAGIFAALVGCVLSIINDISLQLPFVAGDVRLVVAALMAVAHSIATLLATSTRWLGQQGGS